LGVRIAGKAQRRVGATAVKKAFGANKTFAVNAATVQTDDLAPIVDAVRFGKNTAGDIERRVITIAVHITERVVTVAGFEIPTADDAGIVNAESGDINAPWRASDVGVSAIAIQKGQWRSGGIVFTDDLTVIVAPITYAESAAGGIDRGECVVAVLKTKARCILTDNLPRTIYSV
jgi:hypothetical protein